MIIRAYRPGECAVLARLFYDTVHAVNIRDYTQQQVDAWATGQVDLERWERTLSERCTAIAEEDGVIIGFGDMTAQGYLDRLFVHKDHQRRGVASAICDRLEREVKAPLFTANVSITARPFFEQRGYRVVREQRILRRGVWLSNYRMEK